MSSLTTEELAARLKVAPRTLEGWRLQDPPQGPPFVRLGRQVRYPIQAVEEWLADHVQLTEDKSMTPDTPEFSLESLIADLRQTPPPPADVPHPSAWDGYFSPAGDEPPRGRIPSTPTNKEIQQ